MINNAFWKHSLQRYAQPAIAQQCLQWQNDFNSNTNLILLGDWLGNQFTVLSAQQWQAIHEYALPWHTEIVKPLRQVRTALKSKVSNKYIYQLRDSIKEQELAAEQILQSNLYDYCKKNVVINATPAVNQTRADCIKQNIMTYLTTCCDVKEVNQNELDVFSD